MKKLTILGASGHGRVVADIARQMGYDIIEFLDDDLRRRFCDIYPVVGKSEDAEKINNDIFVAIGNASIRQDYMKRLSSKTFPVLIHPKAVIAQNVTIGAGTVVMAGAVINPGSIIGRGCIINTCSSVDHDCVLKDFVHISVGAHLSGNVKVGNNTWMGAGSIASNNISICSNVIVGAGAVLVRDIEMTGTYIGIPAKIMEKKK